MHFSVYLIFCLFAAFLASLRMYLTGTTLLVSFVWNLILAFLPYIFALSYTTWKGKWRWIFLFLWFLFLPNSFYILTDFVHLPKYPEMIYFDIVYISAMAFAGMVSGFASMELIHKEWNKRYHKNVSWVLMIGVVIVSIVGVYMWRFLRFNSWDILHAPWNLVHETWVLITSNGRTWNITDPNRAVESQLFEVGAMWLWQFTLLYSSFFLLVYVYIYHVKKR